MMLALEMFRSVPRTLAGKAVGSRMPGLLGGFCAEIGYTVASCGRMKCARFRLRAPSSSGGAGAAEGRSLERRERKDGAGGGGFLRMDLPGTGMVTADDDAEHDDTDDPDDDIAWVQE